MHLVQILLEDMEIAFVGKKINNNNLRNTYTNLVEQHMILSKEVSLSLS